MSQDSINWEELDREYFELWDWIVRECDGDWTKEYTGCSKKKAIEYQTKLSRFAEICELIDARPQDYYFCWMKTLHDTWYRGNRHCRNEKIHVKFAMLFPESQNFTIIDRILHEIQTEKERYYWLSAIFSALHDFHKEGFTELNLKIARKNYRRRHIRHSEIFDHLLKHKDNITEAANILYDYILDLRLQLDEDSVELACAFSAVKINSVCYEQAITLQRAAIEEFKEFLIPGMKTDGHLHYSFAFCEADIRYPHRRLDIASIFNKFSNVAAIDFFYMCISGDHSDFSHWPDETTHIIDRWSKEHVDCFKDFFIGYGEFENATWQTRFESNIESDCPGVAEKYLRAVYAISKTLNDHRAQNAVAVKANPDVIISDELIQRKQAAYEAYTKGENLKEAGKRIGKEFNQGTELSPKTIASDAEEYAKLKSLPFNKRKRGRQPTKLLKS